MEIQMELWALMNFQDCTFNDDEFHFIVYNLWFKLQSCKQALKLNERGFPMGKICVWYWSVIQNWP